MASRIEINLEILANLLYLTHQEADNLEKVCEYMALAEPHLAELASEIRKSNNNSNGRMRRT